MDPNNEDSLENQVTLGRQLIEAGANANAKAERGLSRVTPLHRACHSAIPTNLEFIKLLLDNGANPSTCILGLLSCLLVEAFWSVF